MFDLVWIDFGSGEKMQTQKMQNLQQYFRFRKKIESFFLRITWEVVRHDGLEQRRHRPGPVNP